MSLQYKSQNSTHRVKDRATTQSQLGFKVCGMQVYRHLQGGYWRCSKRWCKTMPLGAVDKALWTFAHNGAPRVDVGIMRSVP